MSRDPAQALHHPQLDLPDTGSAMKRARSALLSGVLSRLMAGRLVVHTPAGARVEHTAAAPGPEAEIFLHDWRAVRRLLSKGAVGFAEAYMDGEWTSPDLTQLLQLAAANADNLEAVINGSGWLRLLTRLRHLRSANTKRGSRRNIASHYDLGNAFYQGWLDPGMTYSSAYFASPAQSLEQAQAAKQDLVLERLALQGGERVLEIGCGWGGLMERIVQAGAAHVRGITLSTEQLAFARNRLEQGGRADRAEAVLRDYRDVTGSYDRVVSIEMLEAVGEEYWPIYFDTLKARLAPGGSAVIQVITMAEGRFEDYRRGADFIQRYIFPGGMLPTDEIVRREIARAGLAFRSLETFGLSYAQTLAEWRRRFLEAWPAIQHLGFDLRFRRMWEYYLSYCEAGFRAGLLNVGLYSFGHAGESVGDASA